MSKPLSNTDPTRAQAPPDTERIDLPLQVEPDDDDERMGNGVTRSAWTSRTSGDKNSMRLPAQAPSNGTAHNHETLLDEQAAAEPDRGPIGAEAGHMHDMLRWALDSIHEPAIAAADWLARDIDPEQSTAAALLTNPRITLAQVKQAKSVFKTMRIVGEKSADRRVGARMYAAAIAAGLVRHDRLVSGQSRDALKRGFQGLLDDMRMPQPLRDLAGMAICALNEKKYVVDDARDERTHRRPSASEPRPQPRTNGHAPANISADGKVNGKVNGMPRKR